MELKQYINKKDIRYSESSEKADLIVKDFIKPGILSVEVGAHYTEAMNGNCDVLRWWSANKYYGYGSNLVLNGLTKIKSDDKPGLYYRNVLANIEHHNLTMKTVKSLGYVCHEHNSVIYLIGGNFFCRKCGLNKPKNVLNLEQKDFMK
jgi:hypothetical protein